MKPIGFALNEEFIMRVVPKTLVDKVEFYETHLALFTENAAAIGLSAEETSELAAKAAAAREALRAQAEAQIAARAATITAHLAVEELGKLGASMILKIRATAESTHDLGVYSLAGIPLAAEGSPIPAPGRPSRLTTTLGGDGSLLLKWKCDNPRGSVGTMYQISRQIGGSGEASTRSGEASDGEFVPLAVVGKKQFRDETIPAGATAITYRIQAIRSTKQGDAAEFNVNFGSNGRKMSGSFQLRKAA